MVETAIACKAAGLIVGNTTITRPKNFAGPNTLQVGGLSGAPLFERATHMLRIAARASAGRLTLIGCGGIRTGADVLTKLMAGATLVQLYTEFAYAGPALIPRLKTELLEALRQHNFPTARDAIGAGL